MFIQSSEFKRQFKKLPKKIQEKAEERIRILVADERNAILHNHKLSGKSKNYHSINVSGDYRIVYQKFDSSVYFLIEIGAHSELWS